MPAKTDKGMECPHCGGKIVNGVCTKCGYKMPTKGGKAPAKNGGKKPPMPPKKKGGY